MGARFTNSQSLFAFGAHQTNYTTEAAPSTSPPNYRLIVKDGYAKAGYESPNVPNSGESTGLPFANQTYKGDDKTTFSASEQLTYQLLGLRAYDAFGVTGTPASQGSGVYLHTFSLLNPFVSQTLPTRPLASKVAEAAVSTNQIYDARFPAMMANTFAISDSTGKPNLVLNSDWIGSGQISEPSGIKFYGTGKHVLGTAAGEINEEPINKRSGVMSLYPQISYGGTAISTTCLVRSFAPSLNNNLVPDYNCNLHQDGNLQLGSIAGNATTNGQAVALEFTIVADSDLIQAFPVNAMLKAGTEFSAAVLYTGGIAGGIISHSAEFRFARLKIQTAEWVDVDGGLQGLRIVTQPLPVGSVLPLQLRLTTNVADFSTYRGA